MKFKQIDGQNQRIERISPSHLVVGIDMAKEIHVAQAINFRGIVLAKRHLPFTNDLERYEKLQRWVEDLQQKYPLSCFLRVWPRYSKSGAARE
jgi:transposase